LAAEVLEDRQRGGPWAAKIRPNMVLCRGKRVEKGHWAIREGVTAESDDNRVEGLFPFVGGTEGAALDPEGSHIIQWKTLIIQDLIGDVRERYSVSICRENARYGGRRKELEEGIIQRKILEGCLGRRILNGETIEFLGDRLSESLRETESPAEVGVTPGARKVYVQEKFLNTMA